MPRVKLSSLKGYSIAKIEHDDRGLIVIRNISGIIIARIMPEYMFDGEGNRFEDDITD